MRRTAIALGLWAVASVPSAFAATAVTQDVKGSADHPLIKRYDGSVIIKYEHKQFDEYILPLEVKNRKLIRSLTTEGEVTRLYYMIPKGRSPLEVMRNYESDLQKAGYKVIFSATPEDAKYMSQWLPKFGDDRYLEFFFSHPGRVTAWKLSRSEGDVHVLLAAQESGPYNHPFTNGQTVLRVDVEINKSMETNKLVKVGAEEMASAIATTGRVALYGIYFDTNKTDLKSESEPTLEEMSKLLKAQPALKLLVVGHTDNVGMYASNMELSQRRAQAVVDSLVSKYAISKNRLIPLGVSFAAPVASNKTEEGRAKNRRVELVEQ